MVGLLAVARSVCALGREHFLPPVAAWVHPKTQTPIITTAVLGIVTGEDLSIADQQFHAVPVAMLNVQRETSMCPLRCCTPTHHDALLCSCVQQLLDSSRHSTRCSSEF